MHTRVTDKALPRAMEVLDAMAARRGPVTLTPDQFKHVVGRLISMLMTGGQTMAADSPAGEVPARVLALHMAEGARDILMGPLGLTVEDIDPIVRGMLQDLRQLDARSL